MTETIEIKQARLLEAAKKVFNWYFIFGEDNETARNHLANLGNTIKEYEQENNGLRKESLL